MTFSISEKIISCDFTSTESLNSSQVALSCSIQSFFAEATSFSALFSLAAGQGIASIVKSQGLRLLSPLCHSSAAQIISSSLSYISEGISFNIAAELGRSGEFHLGSFTDNLHGISTILVCKSMNRGLLITNLLVQHFAQNSALMTLDLTFEAAGLREKRNIALAERFLEAEITSFRMEVSAKFLAIASPDIALFRATQELDYEGRKTKNTPQNNKTTFNPFQEIFSPALATTHGEKIINPLFSESRQNGFTLKAKELALRMEAKNESISNTQSDAISEESINREKLLQKTPPTVQKKLEEIRKEQPKMAEILEETWQLLYQTPNYINGVVDRGGLLNGYQRAIKRYCLYKPNMNRSVLEEVGIEVFFSRIPEEENYYYPFPRAKSTGEAKSRERKISKSSDSKKKTFEDFTRLEKEDPTRAKWIKLTLSGWSEYCAKKKKKAVFSISDQDAINHFDKVTRGFLRSLNPPIDLDYFYEKILETSIEFIDCQEDILQKSKPIDFPTPLANCSIDLKTADKALQKSKPPKQNDSVTKKDPPQPETLNSFNQLKLSDPPLAFTVKKIWKRFFERKKGQNTIEEFRQFALLSLAKRGRGSKKVKAILDAAVEFFPHAQKILHFEFLIHFINKRRSTPMKELAHDSSLFMLLKAMAESHIGIKKLRKVAKVDTHSLLKEICADEPLTTIKNPRIILRMQKEFEKRGVKFDGARFFERLHKIGDVFPETRQDPPIIYLTEWEFEQALKFNLGLEIITWRFNSQGDIQPLTFAGIAEKIKAHSERTTIRYEMNLIRPTQEELFLAILNHLPSTQSASTRRIAYISSRFEASALIPIEIKTGNKTRRLTVEEVRKFQQERRRKINSSFFKKEMLNAIPESYRNPSGLETYFKEQGYPQLASKAEKYFKMTDTLNIDEIRDLTQCLKLSFKTWMLHFFPHYSYFLGINERGEAILPTKEEIDRIKNPPRCLDSLLGDRRWDSLSIEEKWTLHLFELGLKKFGTPHEAAKGMKSANFRYISYLRKSVTRRSWPNEILAQYTRRLGVDAQKRREIFIYFREEILREIIED